MKKIDDLAAVIAPPAVPNVTISDDRWLDLFERFGTRLPQDFVQFHKRYGSAYFYSISHKRSANLSVYSDEASGAFEKVVPKRLTELRLVKESRPKSVPFPLYWEPYGLLPWGRLSNDTDLCWRVRGELVDNWHVVALRPGSREYEEYEMTMTEYLRAVISGSLQSRLLPTGFPGEKGVGFEVWRFG
jgi:hypothetical protein